MWVSSSYIELFNPYHDKLGRFTFKKGAGAAQVSGKAQKWIDKPVATIGGKTVTRKHVAIAAGVTAAAAVAVGSVVIATKTGDVPGKALRTKFIPTDRIIRDAYRTAPPGVSRKVLVKEMAERVTDDVAQAENAIDPEGFSGKFLNE